MNFIALDDLGPDARDDIWVWSWSIEADARVVIEKIRLHARYFGEQRLKTQSPAVHELRTNILYRVYRRLNAKAVIEQNPIPASADTAPAGDGQTVVLKG